MRDEVIWMGEARLVRYDHHAMRGQQFEAHARIVTDGAARFSPIGNEWLTYAYCVPEEFLHNLRYPSDMRRVYIDTICHLCEAMESRSRTHAAIFASAIAGCSDTQRLRDCWRVALSPPSERHPDMIPLGVPDTRFAEWLRPRMSQGINDWGDRQEARLFGIDSTFSENSATASSFTMERLRETMRTVQETMRVPDHLLRDTGRSRSWVEEANRRERIHAEQNHVHQQMRWDRATRETPAPEQTFENALERLGRELGNAREDLQRFGEAASDALGSIDELAIEAIEDENGMERDSYTDAEEPSRPRTEVEAYGSMVKAPSWAKPLGKPSKKLPRYRSV